MKTKLFSVEIQTNVFEKNEAGKLAEFEEKVNQFSEAHPDYKNSKWMQSSADATTGGFTRITVVLS